MQIENEQISLSNDDKKFIDEMIMMGVIESVENFELRFLARGWYERGYFDRMDEEEFD